MSGVYIARPINRHRRTRQEVEEIRAALYRLLSQEKPMTVRQVFYRLVSQGVIEKTENEYNSTVCRLLSEMRKAGTIPYDWIADNTRWMRKTDSYRSLSQMLTSQKKLYRRALWDNQPDYVEVWLEKDALAGVLMDVTDPWDVPLMVSRGFSSLSFLYEAASEIKAREQPAYLYYLGDFDPSGLLIPKKIEENLRAMAPECEIHFKRVAVNPEQITAMNLPTRPTKKTNSHARDFGDQSVEVDAIPPQVLKGMVRDLIVSHINVESLRKIQAVEAMERETLEGITKKLTDAARGQQRQ